MVVLCIAGAKPAKAAASPVPPVFPEQWDASLDSLLSVQQQLSTQDANVADKIGQRLADAKQALLVPQHSQILHRHAIRLLVQQAADSIDATADTVKQVMSNSMQHVLIRPEPQISFLAGFACHLGCHVHYADMCCLRSIQKKLHTCLHVSICLL